MEDILVDIEMPEAPELLIGLEGRDDAGVYKLNEEQAIIQTVDFFTPMVDDPYIFGQIAAVNSINDIYAMGGKPVLAMNIVCFPKGEDMKILKEIIKGGLSKIKEAGALLVGGHTVDDNEPKYGLAVTGIVHPDKVIGNNGAQVGDALFLTKPVGNGVIATAIKADMISKEHENEAISWMSMLNKEACEIIQKIEGIHALTDVTGFSLVGHLYEMAFASDVQVELYTDKIQFMPGTVEAGEMGLIPGGAYSNREYLADKVEYEGNIDELIRDLIYCPETAGGLLISVDQNKEEDLLQEMKAKDCCCFKVGQVLSKGFKPIHICRSK